MDAQVHVMFGMLLITRIKSILTMTAGTVQLTLDNNQTRLRDGLVTPPLHVELSARIHRVLRQTPV